MYETVFAIEQFLTTIFVRMSKIEKSLLVLVVGGNSETVFTPKPYCTCVRFNAISEKFRYILENVGTPLKVGTIRYILENIGTSVKVGITRYK